MNLATTIRHLMVGRLRWMLATGDERDAEILALRHQILVLQRQLDRPRFTDTDRTILAVLSTAFTRSRLPQIMLIVQPKTVIGWHRRLVARHWTYPPTTRRGRPPTLAKIRRLAIRLAEENPTWGYRRVHGELARLGHRIAASTVWTILRAAGINPTPERTGPTWAQFIRTQAKCVIATDFACVDTATFRQFHVLFFIEIATRRVHRIPPCGTRRRTPGRVASAAPNGAGSCSRPANRSSKPGSRVLYQVVCNPRPRRAWRKRG